MSIRPKTLIAIGLLAVMAGEATAQAGGPAIGATPIPKDAVSNGAVAAATLAAAAAIGMWLSSHTITNHP
jgi:hypothetical protein